MTTTVDAIENKITSATALNIYRYMCRNAEDKNPGWQLVYLDNARPGGLSDRSFSGYLSHLSEVGVYRPAGFAWGEVLIAPHPATSTP